MASRSCERSAHDLRMSLPGKSKSITVSGRSHAASQVRRAAVLTAIVDVACGYAAMTLMPAGASVLTIEYKVNFLSPAQGERMVARGRVVRPGRAVSVCSGDVVAITGDNEKIVATMLSTMATVGRTREDVPDRQRDVTSARGRAAGSHDRKGSTRNRWCICGALRRQFTALA